MATAGVKRELQPKSENTNVFEKETIKKPRTDADALAEAQKELAALKQQMAAEKQNKKAKTTGDEAVFDISHKRRVTVKMMNGTTLLVDIREFYEKNGEMLPGRKGISLTKAQWNKFKEQMDQIDATIEEFCS